MRERLYYNKTLILFLLVVVVIVIFVVSIGKQVSAQFDKVGYPESTLQDVPVDFKDDAISELLSLRISCPTVDYQVCIPDSVRSADEKIVGSVGDIDFIICESTENIDTMIEKVLPNTLNLAVFGRPRTVDVKVRDSGYFYGYPAQYIAMRVNTTISVRQVTTYVVMYQLALTDDTFLYIYLSTETKSLLESAKDLLASIAYSVRPLDESATVDMPSKEDMIENVQEKPSLEKDGLVIYLEKDALYTLEKGIFLLEWMNVDVRPDELTITAPNGEKLSLMTEYSTNGHYVYFVGAMEEGMYVVKGITKEPLRGVVMSTYEWDYYYDEFVTFGFD